MPLKPCLLSRLEGSSAVSGPVIKDAQPAVGATNAIALISCRQKSRWTKIVEKSDKHQRARLFDEIFMPETVRRHIDVTIVSAQFTLTA